VPFTEAFLEELRAKLPVSEIVGRRVKLKRQGAEHVGLSPFNKENSPSFTVSDKKGFYHDFSSGKHGDIFAFIMETEGLDFPQAVEECAKIAGVAIPKANGHDHAERLGDRSAPAVEDDAGSARAAGESGDGRTHQARSRREISKTYDYTDTQGSLIYQVCRMEWTDDGKHKKTFLQRRPAPAAAGGGWIWGLSAGEFLKSRDGDWYKATDERLEQWRGAERRTFTDAAVHGLYRLAEFNELKSADEPVVIAEGEKDVDTLREWGFVATTNSGGARHWRPDHAAMFAGLDVVLAIDNDPAGRDRAEILAKSLRRVARRVRVVDFAAVWDGAPKGADVTDWKDQAGGTAAKLKSIIDLSVEWQAKPFESKFGLIMWGDQSQPGEEYEYLIEDLIPLREPVLIQGESQSGKSFFSMGMGLAGAQGIEFFGHRVIAPFGVVYCAYEAGKGFRARLRAHETHFDIEPGRAIPFGVLTKPIDLWSADVNTDQLIEEILGVADARFGNVPLGAVVIDTHNRANPGASEIDSKDVSRIIERYSRIMDKTRAGIWIIGHKNAAGKHRGNEQLYNNIETAIDISRKTTEGTDKQRVPVRDIHQRAVRVATVLKQREGEDGVHWEFVLAAVEVGTNRYGKTRKSCVAAPAFYSPEDEEAATTQRELSLSDQQTNILVALKNAVAEYGVPPPAGLKLPRSVTSVCTVSQWFTAYRKVSADATEGAVKQAMKRANDKLIRLRVIGRENPYVWLTGRRVKGAIEGRGGSWNSYSAGAVASLPLDDKDDF
jgi:hypothetical protein